MEKNNLIRKGLIFGIILLFVGAGVIPSTVCGMDNVREYIGADAAHSYGFNGSGIIGGVKDAGFDQGHPDFVGQIFAIDGGPSNEAHGTCMFGTIFSSGANNAQAKGMLPNAQGVFCWWGVNRITSVFNLKNWGGVFQSNSWTQGSPNSEYNSYSQEDDICVSNYDITMLWPAGNAGNSGPQSLYPDSVAKNVIAVGAVLHHDDADRANDAWGRHPGIIIGSPSYGPTADGRIKPDLCGPYEDIYTTDNRDGYGCDGYRIGNYVTKGGDAYFGGTAAATAVVGGAAGIVYQMYKENFFGNNPGGDIPHASTVKALLIADAYQYNLWEATRYQQGWGTPDLQKTLDIADRHFIVDEETVLQTDENIEYSFTSDNNYPLKITLVWTDPPAMPGANPALVNDLNLKVTAPDDTVYWGSYGLNVSKWSTSGGTPDHLNNVENVFIEDFQPGEWTIEVIAENITQDAYPGTPEFDQAFALVATTFAPLYADFSYTIDDRNVFFNASLSYDYNGTIISYEWDFGDGANGTGENINHAYSDYGTYNVNLTVTSDSGRHKSILKYVNVSDRIVPICRYQGQNKTYVLPGDSIKLCAQGRDNVALDWAWLATNETGEWQNGSSWNYYKQLNIDNPCEDYQMLIKVYNEDGHDDIGNDTVDCEGHCNLNFSDIRFVDQTQTTYLPYWIEETGTNGSDHYARIWVNTSGDDSIYMYYGNANASSESNATATFIFWDDFSTSAEWTNTDNRIVVDTNDGRVEGKVYRDYDSRLYHQFSSPLTGDFHCQFKAYWFSGTGEWGETALFELGETNPADSYDVPNTTFFWFRYTNQCWLNAILRNSSGDGVTANESSGSNTCTTREWYTCQFVRNDTTLTLRWWDSSHSESSPNYERIWYNIDVVPYNYFRYVNHDTNQPKYDLTFYSDDIIVRKYATTEPSWSSFGSEQSQNGERTYGSPMKMQENSDWQWSNFTWQNSSIPNGTVVGWRIYYMDKNGNVNCTDIMSFTIGEVLCGDCNNDGIINLGDVVKLINYLYRGGDPPLPMTCVGDVNCDGVVNLGDVVKLINYLYRGGDPPCQDCCSPP